MHGFNLSFLAEKKISDCFTYVIYIPCNLQRSPLFFSTNVLNDCIFLANEWAEGETLGDAIAFRDYKDDIWLVRAYSQKILTTEGFIQYFFSPDNLAPLSFLKEVKPFPGGKMIKHDKTSTATKNTPPRHSR